MRLPSIKVALGLALTFVVLWAVFPQHGNAQVTGSQNSIIVETIESGTVSQKVVESARESWPWYLARGSGLVAGVSLVILMLSGIGQITGHTYRFLEPLTAWASHRALGIVFGVSVLLHIFGILFDDFLKFTIAQVLIPWLSSFRSTSLLGFNVGSLYLALGIISFYMSIAIVVSSLLWVSKKPHLWKVIHILSYVLIFMVFVHALFIGTDLASGWLRWVWIISGVSILAASIIRLWRAYTA